MISNVNKSKVKSEANGKSTSKKVSEYASWDDIMSGEHIADVASTASNSSDKGLFYCPMCGEHLSKYDSHCRHCNGILPSYETMLEKYTRKPINQSTEVQGVQKSTQKASRTLQRCFAADNNIAFAAPTFRSYDNFLSLFEDFGAMLETHNIDLSASDRRLLLSAIASSRVLIFDSYESNAIKTLLNITSRFLCGISTEETDILGGTTAKTLFGEWTNDNADGQSEASDFIDTVLLQNIYTSVGLQAPLIQIIGHIGDNNKDLIKWICTYADAPSIVRVINEINFKQSFATPRFWKTFDKGIHIPKTVWFALPNDAVMNEENISSFILYPVLYIEPSVPQKTASNSSSTEPITKISLEDFESLSKNARASFYFGESTFRKLELLEDNIRKSVPLFRFDNCFLRRLECFSSVYMSMGGSELEALDAVMYTFILSAALTSGVSAAALKDSITQIFGETSLPVSLHMLSTII